MPSSLRAYLRSSRYCSPTTCWPGAFVPTVPGSACPTSTGSTHTSASRSLRSKALAATGLSTGSSPSFRMLEREVKLGAGPAFHLPDLNGVVDGATVTAPEAVRLETVYYDTADLRLARWGVSLRHRAGEGWTLKLPPIHPTSDGQAAPLLERDELNFQGGAKKPPPAALAIVRAYVRTAELIPVARLSTVRRRVRLLDAAGARLAEVVDDEVSVRDGRRVAARFREIEVEVTGDADGIVAPLVARLRGAVAGAPDPTPKHIRALSPRAMEPPEVAPLAVEA